MKLARLEAENYQKLTVIDISLTDGLNEISGPNGSGKSSLIDAILACLKGPDYMSEDPVRHGTEQSIIRTHLKGDNDSYLIATRIIRPDRKTDLRLETPEGARFGQPATHLKQLISDHMLDPLEFIELKDADQMRALEGFAPGFKFEENRQKRKGAFDKRTEVKRDLARERAAAGSIAVPAGTPEHPIDVAEISAKVEQAVKANADIDSRRQRRETAQARIAQLREEAISADDAIQKDYEIIRVRAAEEIEVVTHQIKQLEAQIAALNARKDDICARRNSDFAANEAAHLAKAREKNLEADAIANKLAEADALPEKTPDEEIAGWRATIQQAAKTNENVALLKRQREHVKAADGWAEEVVRLEAILEACDKAEQEAIQLAKLPVEGLGFGDGFITYKGVRFSQLSTAEKLRVAFALIVAKNPKVRICWIRDASLLDDNSLKIVEALAVEFDVQVLLETVRPNSGNAILMQDGHVAGQELEPRLTAPKVAPTATKATRQSVVEDSNTPAKSPIDDAPQFDLQQTDQPKAAPRARRRFVGPDGAKGEEK